MLSARSMIATAFRKSCSFAECVLQEISGACVDAKLRGIEVICIVGGDRGYSCASSYRGGCLLE